MFLSGEIPGKALTDIGRFQPSNDLIEILRSHAPGAEEHGLPGACVGSVCMHSGGMMGDPTTGSLMAVLRQDKPFTLWSTGCSTPCISAFKPVFWNADIPPIFGDAASLLIL